MGCCFTCFSSDPVSPDHQKKIDSNFSGSVKDRTCTDTPFLLLLVACLVLLGGLTLYAVKHGDTRRLFNGYDTCGNVCGIKSEREYNANFSNCPIKDYTHEPLLQVSSFESLYSPKKGERSCVSKCSQDHFQVLNRCLPKEFEKDLDSFFNKTGVSEIFQEAVDDLNLTKWVIVKLLLFSLVFSLIIVFLLRYIAGFVVWFVLIGVTVVSIGTSAFLWITFYEKSKMTDRHEIIEREINTYFTYAIVVTFATLIILVLILVMRKRIKLVVRLFKEAGLAIQDMPLLLVQPFFTFLSMTIVSCLLLYFAILVQGGGFLHMEPLNHFLYYKKDFAMKFSRVYILFMFFWLIQFCIGCQHMIISGSVATWFFTRDKNNVRQPISTAVSNLFSYHLGSVALGSFIIAIVQLIRLIFNAIKESMKKSENDTIKSIYGCLKCCFDVIEKCVQYITRNAYIEVAMFGTSFCRGGQQAFILLTSNALRVAAINSIGDFVLFLGKLLVVISTIFLGFWLIDPIEGVQNLGIPLTLVGIISYFIAHCFFTVYEMVIDTIFLCFCEDCEINDGQERPYFMNSGLMEFVDSSNRQIRVGDAVNSA